MEDNQSLIESLNYHIANLQEDGYLANKGYKIRREASRHPIQTGMKWGTAMGAVGGAIKGGITGGRSGAIKGALKYGTAGALGGAAAGGAAASIKHDVGASARYAERSKMKDQFDAAKQQRKLALQRQKNQEKLRKMR